MDKHLLLKKYTNIKNVSLAKQIKNPTITSPTIDTSNQSNVTSLGSSISSSGHVIRYVTDVMTCHLSPCYINVFNIVVLKLSLACIEVVKLEDKLHRTDSTVMSTHEKLFEPTICVLYC